MTEQEIKETIIACVDYAAEYEKCPKDILSELYEYIEIWYHSRRIDEDKLDELAFHSEKETFKEQDIPFQTKWVEGFKAGYRKAKEE